MVAVFLYFLEESPVFFPAETAPLLLSDSGLVGYITLAISKWDLFCLIDSF